MAGSIYQRRGFLDPLDTKQFPGSSGYWWGQGTNSMPGTQINGRLPGQTALERQARAVEAEKGYYHSMPGVVRSGGPYTGWDDRYGGGIDPRGPNNGGDPRFNSLVVPKFPGMDFGIEGMNKSLQSTPLPKYGETLSAVQKGAEALPGAFDRYSQEIDPTAYAAGQRGFNPQYNALTGGYENASRGYGTRFDTAGEGYQGDLGDLTRRDYEQQANFDKAQEDVYGRIAAGNQKAFSKYGIGTNSNAGLSSAGLSGLITSNSDAAVRLNLAKQARMDEAMGREQQRLGLGYGVEQNRYAADRQLETDIYGRRTADVERAQATERHLEEIKRATAGMNLEAAIRKVPTLAAAAADLARVQNMPLDDILKRAQTVEGLIRLMQQANYTGAELVGGANVSQPQYFDNNGLPNRYGPNIGNSGGGGGTGTNNAAGGEMRFNPKTGQMQMYTRDEMNTIRAGNVQNQGRFSPGVPFDPGRVGPGAGYELQNGNLVGTGGFGPGINWNDAYQRGGGNFQPRMQSYYDAIADRYQ